MMFTPDPGTDIYPSRIPDLGSNNSKKKGETLVVLPFFVTTKYYKIKLFYFWTEKEKNLSQLNWQRILEGTFYPNNCH